MPSEHDSQTEQVLERLRGYWQWLRRSKVPPGDLPFEAPLDHYIMNLLCECRVAAIDGRFRQTDRLTSAIETQVERLFKLRVQRGVR